MEFGSWLLFASIITLASISPGPNVLAVIVNTVDKGVSGALFTIVGNLIALFTIALVAAIGVGTLIQSMPSVFATMKIAGGAYLFWMGLKMLRSSFSPMAAISSTSSQEIGQAVRPLSLIIQAMLISYSNPKSILFLSAVFPTFLSSANSTVPQFGIMFLTIICIVSLIHGSYAILTLRLKGYFVSGRTRQRTTRITGLSFMGFGAGFIVDSQR